MQHCNSSLCAVFMQLPALKISSKVKSMAITAALTTVVVGIVTDSPLGETAWGKPFKNATTVGALVTLLSGIAGYQTTEKAYSEGDR